MNTIIKQHECEVCHSPAINTICSNAGCSSWSRYKAIAGMSAENPLYIYCPECKKHNCGARSSSACCHNCGHYFKYGYMPHRWYMSMDYGENNVNSGIIIKYVGAPPNQQWDIGSMKRVQAL